MRKTLLAVGVLAVGVLACVQAVALPTVTPTATPLPAPPTSRQSGMTVVGIIILTALIAAGAGSWLGKKKTKIDTTSGAEND